MKETLDCEVVLNRIVTIVQNNINSKLTAIDTEKNDGISLKQFSAPGATGGTAQGAYAIITTDDQIKNFNPFMYIGAQQPEAQGIGPFTALKVNIDLVAVLLTEGGDTNVWKRLLRYQRALKEIIQENWDDSSVPGNMYIESLEPRPLDELGNEPYMGVGIRVKVSIS